MYHTLLFDLDGTLTDPGLGITNSVAYALEKMGRPVPPRQELYKFIGPPLIESFTRFCGLSSEDSLRALAYYREYFSTTGIFENRPYDGTADTLASLRAAGKRLLLATSKPEVFAEKILAHFDLADYFDVVAGATMDNSRTTKADVIRYALARAGISDLSGVLMIGDREHDVLGAKAVGLASLGVLYGYGSREELVAAGADHIVATIGEIPAACGV